MELARFTTASPQVSANMDSVTALSAPEITVVPTEESPRARERRAFDRLLPSLLQTHPGQFVAVHNGKVITSGSDRISVALEAYRQVGYVALYVGLASEAPRPRVRIPSPRVRRAAATP
jgi:hypothetical protein